MPYRLLDLRLFRYAMVSAEHGSFRRAAAALNMQQSSVSKGVRSLEDRVGTPLFERSHAGVRPTPAGETFLQEAALGFDHLERAMQRLGAIQRGERGELTVAASVPFLLVGDAFEQFREKHRGVSVEMVEGTCDASVALVGQRKADVAFVTRISANGVAQSLHLRDERLIAVLPSSHPLAKARAVMLEELVSETIILGASGLGPEVADQVKRHLANSAGGPSLQLHRTGQCDVVNMVARGFGISIVVGHLRYPAPEGVVLLPLAGMSLIPIHAVWMAANPNPALKAMLAMVRRATSDRN